MRAATLVTADTGPLDVIKLIEASMCCVAWHRAAQCAPWQPAQLTCTHAVLRPAPPATTTTTSADAGTNPDLAALPGTDATIGIGHAHAAASATHAAHPRLATAGATAALTAATGPMGTKVRYLPYCSALEAQHAQAPAATPAP